LEYPKAKAHLEDRHSEGKTLLKWLSESCGCIKMAKDRIPWQALVNMLTNPSTLIEGSRFCGQLSNYQLIGQAGNKHPIHTDMLHVLFTHPCEM